MTHRLSKYVMYCQLKLKEKIVRTNNYEKKKPSMPKFLF
jgi:hypothetical protein